MLQSLTRSSIVNGCVRQRERSAVLRCPPGIERRDDNPERDPVFGIEAHVEVVTDEVGNSARPLPPGKTTSIQPMSAR